MSEFFLTTAEEERNLFFGEIQAYTKESENILPPGEYRVIDGKLCRIVSGLSKDELKIRMGLNPEEP